MIILLQTIISKDDNKGVRMGGSIGRPRQGRAPFNRLLSSLPLVVGPTSPSHILPSSWYFPHTTICFQCNCGKHLHLKRRWSKCGGRIGNCFGFSRVWSSRYLGIVGPDHPHGSLSAATSSRLTTSHLPCSKNNFNEFHIIPPKPIGT